MPEPAVSVVMPVFDRRHTLPRAIGSVLAQTRPVAELVVVDDGSRDGSVELVEEIAASDPRVRSIRQAHAGATAARNRGIAEARGELIAFQDSDDEWDPRFLERLIPLVAGRHDTVAFATHRLRYLDGSSERVPAEPVTDPAHRLLTRSIISTQTAVVPAEVLARVGGFDPDLRRFQDWDLWLRVIEAGGVRFVHLDEELATLYRGEDSISAGGTAIRSASLRRILRSHLPLFARHPRALGRLVARAYLRPGVPSRSTAAADRRTALAPEAGQG